jgi:peptide/nickel transport system substrate-binding protein
MRRPVGLFLGATALCGSILGAGAAFAEKKTLFVGMASADAGKLDPHLTATTPDKGLAASKIPDFS